MPFSLNRKAFFFCVIIWKLLFELFFLVKTELTRRYSVSAIKNV